MISQLTETIPKAIQRASIPGAIVGVWQDGTAPYVRAFGVRDTASGEPMTTDLYMRIGSLTKSFTVTAVLRLVEQGKVGLDDPISKYVADVPNGDAITIRELAAMRSGLYNYGDEVFPALSTQPQRQWAPPELLDISFRRPPLFPPGIQFDYSNTNTVLLGLVVEKVSGQSLHTYIEEHLLRPEGLTHTGFGTDGKLPDPHANGYTKTSDGTVVDATDWNPSWGWAAGDMVSTLDDVHAWTHALATGKLLGPTIQREREKFLPAPGEGEGALYGLGIDNENGWLGHSGNISGYVIYPYYLPAQGITMVVMFNSNADVPGGWNVIEQIVKIIAPDHHWPRLPEML